MKVGIIQSNYIPWRGYFDFIDDVDLFVIHDDLQYTKGDWRNRNQIKVLSGSSWLTVPVNYHKTSQLICNTLIEHSQKWQSAHIKKFFVNYSKSPYVHDALELLQEALDYLDPTISQLNIRLINLICAYLNITTPMVMSSNLDIFGTKTERIIQILKKVGASAYLSGPTAKAYLDEQLLRDNGFKLEYKTYDYDSYPQPHGEFIGNVTILDLIANVGLDARKLMKSKTPNQLILQPHCVCAASLS